MIDHHYDNIKSFTLDQPKSLVTFICDICSGHREHLNFDNVQCATWASICICLGSFNFSSRTENCERNTFEAVKAMMSKLPSAEGKEILNDFVTFSETSSLLVQAIT